MDFLYIPDATFIIAVEWYRTETIEMLFVSLCQPLMMMMILQIFYWISIQPIEKKNGLEMRTERMFLRASSETKQKSHCITIFFFVCSCKKIKEIGPRATIFERKDQRIVATVS